MLAPIARPLARWFGPPRPATSGSTTARPARSGADLRRWVFVSGSTGDKGLVVEAFIRSEARAAIKRQLGIRGRLPLGSAVWEWRSHCSPSWVKV